MRGAAMLFLVGLSSFLLGWPLSLGMTTIFAQMGTWFYVVVGPAVLTPWMVVSGTFDFKGSKRGMTLTILYTDLLALVVLVLLGMRELSPHTYWDNAVGPLARFFCLSLLRLGVIVAMWTEQVFWFYFDTFLLLVLSSWLGCRAKDPVKK